MKLTPRQQEILDFIKNTVEVLGAPPTRAEIACGFRLRFAQRGGRPPQGAGQERSPSTWSRVRRGASAWSNNSACR